MLITSPSCAVLVVNNGSHQNAVLEAHHTKPVLHLNAELQRKVFDAGACGMQRCWRATPQCRASMSGLRARPLHQRDRLRAAV